jgi:hypothetical protein
VIRHAALVCLTLTGCGADRAAMREVTTNPQTGLTLRVGSGQGRHAHPAVASEAEVRAALLADGNFVESDISYLAGSIAATLRQLQPDEFLSLHSWSSDYRLFVDAGQLVLVKLDGGEEVGRSVARLGGSAPPAPSPAAPAPVAAAPSPPPPAAPSPPPVAEAPLRRPVHVAGQPQNLALIIGVERYRDLPRVDHARADAERMRAYVHDVLDLPDDHIVLLTDGNASLTDINKYIDGWLPRMARGADRLYFYFAGHGSPDVSSGAAHLVPYDGDPRFLKETALSLATLYQRLAKSGVREVVVMLDACFTGTGGRSVLPRGARPLVRVIAPEKPPAPLVVITAAGPLQITGPYSAGDAGLFTHFLMEGLSGAADADGDGQISADELIRYVRPRVDREARKENREQTPELMVGREGPSVILIRGIRNQ